jgi:hypothetical protein
LSNWWQSVLPAEAAATIETKSETNKIATTVIKHVGESCCI